MTFPGVEFGSAPDWAKDDAIGSSLIEPLELYTMRKLLSSGEMVPLYTNPSLAPSMGQYLRCFGALDADAPDVHGRIAYWNHSKLYITPIYIVNKP